jgi:hypothetical protein
LSAISTFMGFCPPFVARPRPRGSAPPSLRRAPAGRVPRLRRYYEGLQPLPPRLAGLLGSPGDTGYRPNSGLTAAGANSPAVSMLGLGLSGTFPFTRNHCDRFVHLAYGALVGGPPVELLQRAAGSTGGPRIPSAWPWRSRPGRCTRSWGGRSRWSWPRTGPAAPTAGRTTGGAPRRTWPVKAFSAAPHRFGAGSNSIPEWSARMRTRSRRNDIFLASAVACPPVSWSATSSEPLGSSTAFP